MASSSVELLYEKTHDWVVIVVEDGSESRKSFKIEQHARSFADGQRVRLGLPPVNEPIFKRLKDGGGTLTQ